MEKVTKEELMKKLNLTEEELEKVAGGLEGLTCKECRENCNKNNHVQDSKDKTNCEAMCAAVCR